MNNNLYFASEMFSRAFIKKINSYIIAVEKQRIMSTVLFHLVWSLLAPHLSLLSPLTVFEDFVFLTSRILDINISHKITL